MLEGCFGVAFGSMVLKLWLFQRRKMQYEMRKVGATGMRGIHTAEYDKATTTEGMVALILVSDLNKPKLQFPKTLISAVLNSKTHSYDHYLGHYWSDALSG
jgi:hypothetical protein